MSHCPYPGLEGGVLLISSTAWRGPSLLCRVAGIWGAPVPAFVRIQASRPPAVSVWVVRGVYVQKPPIVWVYSDGVSALQGPSACDYHCLLLPATGPVGLCAQLSAGLWKRGRGALKPTSPCSSPYSACQTEFPSPSNWGL